MISNPQLTRLLQATASTLVMVGLWQIASMFFPPYLFPPVPDIVSRTVGILLSWPLLAEVLITEPRASLRDCSGPSCWAA
jgi:ABC-type nitrate/sulfonate/bicarbonate transport system permease component